MNRIEEFAEDYDDHGFDEDFVQAAEELVVGLTNSLDSDRKKKRPALWKKDRERLTNMIAGLDGRMIGELYMAQRKLYPDVEENVVAMMLDILHEPLEESNPSANPERITCAGVLSSFFAQWDIEISASRQSPCYVFTELVLELIGVDWKADNIISMTKDFNWDDS
ncbi:MAG: hypothetical protein ABJN62_09670 [Halioglobus sp.]